MQQTEPPIRALMRMLMGYQVSQAIHVAVVLGVADQLRDGARSSDDLASVTRTDPGGLYRLLRALAAVGVFEEGADRAFSLTPIGQHLRTDLPESAAAWAAYIGQPSFWNTWGSLSAGVKTGENVFRQLHGEDVWTSRARDPQLSRLFDDAMTSRSSAVSRQVVAAYDFSQFSIVVDVGGGRGGLLAEILHANPDVHGILFDQPHVVSDELLTVAGVHERCDVVGGSFFESVPPGGDAYVLKSIIHDWEDDESKVILKTCREAISPDGKLLLVEQVVGPPNEGPMTKFSDLNMLVMPGGRERTEQEFAQLFKASGFKLTRVVETAPDQSCVIEGVPV